MAKISTYPIASPVSQNDYVIGTDSVNSNQTKNFLISDILSFVNIQNYVPYVGAFANVDLGIYGLISDSVSTNSILTNTIQTWNGIAFVTPNAPIVLNGDQGNPGQVLKSNGVLLTPSWSDVANVVAAGNGLWKGSFYDTQTQTLLAGANAAMPMILNFTDNFCTNGVGVNHDGVYGNTLITVSNTAVYNVMFSAQFTNSGGTGQTVDIWLRKNGTNAAANVPNSNGNVHLQGNQTFVMAAWNYFINLNAGDFIQICWTATSTNITMVPDAATAVHPEAPSIIVTLNQV